MYAWDALFLDRDVIFALNSNVNLDAAHKQLFNTDKVHSSTNLLTTRSNY